MRVRIVADDLTGALDTAAPLVALAGPLPVYWNPARATAGSFALDTESRDIDVPGSTWLDALSGADLAYKKIDSLLRGKTAREVAACLASERFPSAVIAPAFPAQQRITAGGRQHWRADAALPWQAVACDLRAELRDLGVIVRLAAGAEALAGGGHFFCDAASEPELAALVDAGRRLEPPVLWCGSAGLARALAGAPRTGSLSGLEPPLLIVIGSHHPVTLAQVEALAGGAPEALIRVPPDAAVGPAIGAAADALARHGRAALVIALPDGTGAEIAGPVFDRVLGRACRELPPPRSLIVTGGATLHRLVQVLEADALLVAGEPLPGIARSSLQGGRWHGCAVISKSGAFGDPGLLIRLADCAKGDRPEGDRDD
jgi:D-threonate/D-erythronate kinase